MAALMGRVLLITAVALPLHASVHRIQYGLVKMRKGRSAHAASDLHQQRWHKRYFALIPRQTDKELQIRILLDLLDRLLVTQAQLVLDDHRTDHQPCIFGRSTVF